MGVKVNLPKKVEISGNIFNELEGWQEVSDFVSDYLSDNYGYCHKGFEIEIIVSNIKWDKT